MSIIDKAAQVILDHDADGTCSEPECLARDLAEAGLLIPDLPEPDKNSSTGTPVWWEKGTLGVTVYPDGEIGMMVDWDKEARYTAETAREQALALLAAASCAENGVRK